MSIGYVYLRPLPLVCMRAIGPYGQSSAAAWKEVLSWREKSQLKRSITRGFGLMLDDPRATPGENCRYEACVEFQPEFEKLIPESFRQSRLPGGAYARQRHLGTEGLGETIAAMRDGWVTSQGLTIDAKRPFIEIHLDDPALTAPEKLRIDICLPVKFATDRARSAA